MIKAKSKNKKTYWAVCQKENVKFKGTFKECWNFFVENYSQKKVATLIKDGVVIKRTL